MKKFFITILAVVYLAVSSGFAMTIHYCMGKVFSIDLFHQNDKCGKCGMKTGSGCCKDEFKIIKLSDTHNLVANDVNTSAPVVILHNSYSAIDNDIIFCETSLSLNNNSPPPSQLISLCILHSVFRI